LAEILILVATVPHHSPIILKIHINHSILSLYLKTLLFKNVLFNIIAYYSDSKRGQSKNFKLYRML